jgi:hypothetical protein
LEDKESRKSFVVLRKMKMERSLEDPVGVTSHTPRIYFS